MVAIPRTPMSENRIRIKVRDYVCDQVAAGDGEAIVYELINSINRERYNIESEMRGIQTRLDHIRTALSMGRGLNDLGEMQGAGDKLDVAIAKYRLAWDMLGGVLAEDLLKILRENKVPE